MNHIDDYKIYLYVFNPMLIKEDELSIIEFHLSICRDCMLFFEEVMNFLQEFRKLENIKIDYGNPVEKIKAFKNHRVVNKAILSELDSPILVLRPFNVFEAGQKPFSRLVAEQNTDDLDNFRHIFTYASAHKFVILRVLYNPAKKLYNLYLVCDDMSKVGNALINFEGEEDEYLADNNGIVKINRDFIAENINVYLHLPISKFDIDFSKIFSAAKSVTITSKEKIKLNLSKYNGDIKAVLEFEDKINVNEIKAVVIYGNNQDKHETYELIENTFSFPEPGFDNVKIVLVQKQ